MSKRLPLVRFKMGRTPSCNNLLVLNCKVFDTLAPNVLPGFSMTDPYKNDFQFKIAAVLNYKKKTNLKNRGIREKERKRCSELFLFYFILQWFLDKIQ